MGFSRLRSALQDCQMESQVKFYLYSAILQTTNLPLGEFKWVSLNKGVLMNSLSRSGLIIFQ